MEDDVTDIIANAMTKARAGDLTGALSVLVAGRQRHPDDRQLAELRGLIAVRAGRLEAAVDAFRQLLVLDPTHMAARVNLATALMERGELDEAWTISNGYDHPKLRHIAAAVQQSRGQGGSVADYEELVAADPRDHQAWNNLGNLRLAAGDVDGALVAFDRASSLRPDLIPICLNFAEALRLAGQFDRRQLLMRSAVTRVPNDPEVQMALGLAEAACGATAHAERAFEAAINLSPGFSRAYVELGLLLESVNRLSDLDALIREAEARRFDEPEIIFLKAWLERRRGNNDRALALAEAIPPSIHPLRRNHLIAELYDRVGRVDEAFDAFSEMNRQALATQVEPSGPTYLERLQLSLSDLMQDGLISASMSILDDRPDPTFIVGFPRSGTTLLDTFLMNAPEVMVLEEQPALARAMQAAGVDERHEKPLSDAERRIIREAYFDEVSRLSPDRTGALVIDKHPLHMTRAATIHQVFPRARIVMVERHPCDAVLSCFMANFQLNTAMRSFTRLDQAAAVYDTAFGIWKRTRQIMPDMSVHTVRYERLVSNLEAELRPLLRFLDIEWSDLMLDHRASAKTRGHVRTASYSQITEPLYQRAVYRWERYRHHMAAVLPVLHPWVDDLGYDS